MPTARFKSAETGQLWEVGLSEAEILAALGFYTARGARRSGGQCSFCLAVDHQCHECALGKQLPYTTGNRDPCIVHIPGLYKAVNTRRWLCLSVRAHRREKLRYLREFRQHWRRAFGLEGKK